MAGAVFRRGTRPVNLTYAVLVASPAVARSIEYRVGWLIAWDRGTGACLGVDIPGRRRS